MTKRVHIFLRIAISAVLLLAPPFATRKAAAQFVVTDVGAAAQRIKASVTEAVNFALEMERMAEQLLTATGQLDKATELASQMKTVYDNVSNVVKKGREIMALYRTIDNTRRNLEAIVQEYQYYANGGQLSAARVRRMNYVIRNITANVNDIVDYITNTLFAANSGTSNTDKTNKLMELNDELEGNNLAAQKLLEQDRRDMAASALAKIEQAMIQEMGFGNGIRTILGEDALPGSRLGSGFGSSSTTTLLPAIDWDKESNTANNDPLGTQTSSQSNTDRLFRIVYILEVLITILMTPIAFYRKNKGEANAQDAILKVVVGFFFAVILTNIVQAAFFA